MNTLRVQHHTSWLNFCRALSLFCAPPLKVIIEIAFRVFVLHHKDRLDLGGFKGGGDRFVLGIVPRDSLHIEGICSVVEPNPAPQQDSFKYLLHVSLVKKA